MVSRFFIVIIIGSDEIVWLKKKVVCSDFRVDLVLHERAESSARLPRIKNRQNRRRGRSGGDGTWSTFPYKWGRIRIFLHAYATTSTAKGPKTLQVVRSSKSHQLPEWRAGRSLITVLGGIAVDPKGYFYNYGNLLSAWEGQGRPNVFCRSIELRRPTRGRRRSKVRASTCPQRSEKITHPRQ